MVTRANKPGPAYMKCGKKWSIKLGVHVTKSDTAGGHKCAGAVGHPGPCVCRKCGCAEPVQMVNACPDCGAEHNASESHECKAVARGGA